MKAAGSQVSSESFTIELANGEKLYIKRFYNQLNAPPALMIHGSVENGRIFYSNSGKGFAPFLADQGFDVLFQTCVVGEKVFHPSHITLTMGWLR